MRPRLPRLLARSWGAGKSQLKLLDKQIAYSEFTVKIEKDVVDLPYDARTNFTYKLGQGLVARWEGLKSMIVFLISIWPLYLLIAIFIFGMRKIIKR